MIPPSSPSPIPLTGKLKAVPLPRLLHFLRSNDTTGVLTVQSGEIKKSIHLQEGKILFAASHYPNDRLAEVFLRAGKINFKQYDIAAEIFNAGPRKKGAILLEQGFIKPKDLFDMLIVQFKEIALSLFHWEDAQYAFCETTLPAEEAMGIVIDTNEIIKDGIYRVSEWTRLIAFLPPLDSILEKNQKVPSGSLISSDQEKEVFSLIDNERSIRDLLMLSSTKALAWAQILNMLIATNLLLPRVSALGPRTQEKEPVSAAAGTYPKTFEKRREDPQEEKTRTWTEEVVEEEPREVQFKKIYEAYEKMRSQNYYELLGLTPKASPEEIKRAYFKLAKKYHPDRYAEQSFAEVIREVEALFIQVTKAYDTLSVESKRSDYDNELKKRFSGSQAKQGGPSTQEFFDQAEAACRANDLKTAIYFFEETIRIMPEGHEKASVYLRYGQVLSSVPGQLHSAVEALQKSTILDPSNTKPHLELGLVFSKAGLIDKARAAFQEALKRDPGNKTATEELARLKVKK